jgi:hypothetical protein
MADAYHADIKANKSGKPALSKLILLDQVCRELKKLSIQEVFLDNMGQNMLGHWLERLPD